MSALTSSIPRFMLGGCLLLLFTSVVFISLSGHDWQRAAQSALAFICFLAITFYSTTQTDVPFLNPIARNACVLIVGLGILSVWDAHWQEWAVIEFSVLVACCCIAWAVALGRRNHSDTFDRLIISFVVFLCGVKVAQFIAASTAAFTQGLSTLDTGLLLEGFSNPRFYGQFQTFTLPLLALPLLLTTVKRSAKAWLFVLFACWWMIAICGGTRGTWLGVSCTAGVMFFCGPYARRWVAWQLCAAASGLLLFWCLFSLLPDYLGIKIVNFAGDRLTTSLSARDIIWHQAWEMIKERPWLGFGPMHFADIHNPIAAHPHQAILQWACEWGVPSTLLVGGLAAQGLFATLKLVRSKSMSSEPVDLLRICLFASLLGALTQSMVDGVIVMPYSQVWLAIVVGWLLGIHEWSAKPQASGAVLRWSWMATMALAIGFLMYVVARDFPHLNERDRQYAHDFGGNLQPRFWEQGVIAVKPQ
ncbi:O-antigen ligase family protein [Xanthomonas sp. WHRI 1810A]|uniref:O-antigen ligase family protein n=1 Tax=Xanthomonas sp. WHRI 1810A TaxID=3161565 RepID=UPI0032E88A14